MSITSFRRAVKPYRNTIKLSAPFGAGLDYHRLPPEAEVDAMPRKLVRDGAVLTPEPILTLSGAWALPGEDVHSWDFGHDG